MKLSLKNRPLLALSLVVPVAIFFAARSAASWRPQLVARQDNIAHSWNRGAHFLRLSPDEKWLVSEGEDQVTSTLWNLEEILPQQNLKGTGAVFSKDSRFIATYDRSSEELFLYDHSRLQWHKRPQEKMEISQIGFASDASQLHYNTDNPDGVATNLGNLLVVGDLLVTLDTQTGKEVSRDALGATIWQTQSLDNVSQSEAINPNAGTKISRITPDANTLVFSLNTSNSFDQWEVAPDDKHLWVSQGKHNRFDIHDARTGRKLWSYSSTDTNSGEFNCDPSWEDGGKTLATIENDTLFVRDAHTGKIVLARKNTLPDPIVSWTFTKDGNTVYLMDAQGRIFRQRLS